MTLLAELQRRNVFRVAGLPFVLVTARTSPFAFRDSALDVNEAGLPWPPRTLIDFPAKGW